MGGKGSKEQVSEVRLDPNTQRYVQNEMRPVGTALADYYLGGPVGGYGGYGGQGGGSFLERLFGQHAGGAPGGRPMVNWQRPDSFVPGANPLTGQAIGQLGQLYGQSQGMYGAGMDAYQAGLAGASRTGARGIGGYLSPYLQNVGGAMQDQFANQQALTSQRAQQLATQGGAYGGSRSAVLEGQMQADTQRNQNLQIQQLYDQGYQNAMLNLQQDRSRQAQLAQMGAGVAGQGMYTGMGITSALGGYGDYLRNISGQQLQEPFMLGQAAQNALGAGLGPYGQVNTTQMPSNKFGQAAGGALTGFSLGGPLGAGIGAGAGLLFGGL